MSDQGQNQQQGTTPVAASEATAGNVPWGSVPVWCQVHKEYHTVQGPLHVEFGKCPIQEGNQP